MEDELRKTALLLAVDLHKLWLKEGHISCSAELQIEDIRHVAARFYDFLKGEIK
jgi:hypothetical protein